MKLAYLISSFPALSETFVSNEIVRLGDRGLDMQIYAFARTPAADRDKLTLAARALAERTVYIGKREALFAALSSPQRIVQHLFANARMQAASTGKPRSLMRLLRATRLARLLEQQGITHLHAHWPYATEVAWLVHRMTGIPFSISVHAHEVAHENGHFPLVFPSLSFATFCNCSAMEYLLSQLPDNVRSKSYLVYHGVDVGDFSTLPLPSSSEPLRVVSAGRLTPTKGFDRLIRACALARQRGIAVELTVLGRGTEDVRLLEVAESCGFAQYLKLPGWVSHGELQGYLARSHVFAMLADTTFHDGLPNVVLEAMASGRPVILSPLPAAGEAVDDGVEGFILDSTEDFDGFVKVIRSMATQPSMLTSMGAAGRARVVRDHDAKSQIVRLKQLFDELPMAKKEEC